MCVVYEKYYFYNVPVENKLEKLNEFYLVENLLFIELNVENEKIFCKAFVFFKHFYYFINVKN